LLAWRHLVGEVVAPQRSGITRIIGAIVIGRPVAGTASATHVEVVATTVGYRVVPVDQTRCITRYVHDAPAPTSAVGVDKDALDITAINT